MKNLAIMTRHELRILLLSPATYVAAVLFLIVMGFFFQGVVVSFARAPQESTPITVFLELFWIPVLFMVPLLTMKSFAEEKRMGTLESLLTTPVTATEVVLSKFLSAYLLYCLLWAITLGFPYILHRFEADPRITEMAPIAGGYLFLALSGLLFTSAGIFASALTRSQLVAGLLSFTLIFGLIVGGRYASEMTRLNIELTPAVRNWIDYIQVFQHGEDLSRGIVDTRPILFYLSTTALALAGSIFVIESNVWRK